MKLVRSQEGRRMCDHKSKGSWGQQGTWRGEECDDIGAVSKKKSRKFLFLKKGKADQLFPVPTEKRGSNDKKEGLCSQIEGMKVCFKSVKAKEVQSWNFP